MKPGGALSDTDRSAGTGIVAELRRREPVLSHRGLVSSSHPVVTLAWARVLADGGTAIDASLAMAAMAFVALPAQCGPGGDVFALYHRAATGEFLAVHGSGWVRMGQRSTSSPAHTRSASIRRNAVPVPAGTAHWGVSCVSGSGTSAGHGCVWRPRRGRTRRPRSRSPRPRPAT
jgi:gamma-glutamyltranspeptidase / glutathione hydrolase